MLANFDIIKTMEIRIKTTNIELTPAIEEYVNNKIGSIDKLLDGMKQGAIKMKVEIGKTTQHHRKGDIFRAELNLTVPGKLLRTEAEEWDLRVAIDQAKKDLERKIRKYRGKQRAKYERGARKAKKLLRISPLAWFRKEKK